MNYYVITQKKERGCPIGDLDAVLHDHIPKKLERIEHGLIYPWYSDPEGMKEFPNSCFLVVKERPLEFAIRPLAYMLQVVDQAFLDTLIEFNASIKDYKPIKIFRASDGKEFTGKNYYISMFSRTFYRKEYEVLNESESVVEMDDLGHLRLCRVAVRSDFSGSVFGIELVNAANNTIICSEEFFKAAESRGVKGIDFIKIENAKWADPNLFTYDPENILPVL